MRTPRARHALRHAHAMRHAEAQARPVPAPATTRVQRHNTPARVPDAIGIGPLNMVVISEMFPFRLRAVAMSLALFLNRLVSGAVPSPFRTRTRTRALALALGLTLALVLALALVLPLSRTTSASASTSSRGATCTRT